jgi:hypothetical protein
MQPRFGVYLSKEDSSSQITFGGHDETRMSGELQWAPVVHPELGHWTVKIHHVRVGGEVLDLCEDGDCRAIVDSGTSLLGVPQAASQRMNYLLARKVAGAMQTNCRNEPGPDIVIDLGGIELTLGAEDYSRPAAVQVLNSDTNEATLVCRAQLLPVAPQEPLGSKIWILGEPFLQRYYSVFDWETRSVGFAPAVATTSSPSSGGHTDPAAESEPTVVMI